MIKTAQELQVMTLGQLMALVASEYPKVKNAGYGSLAMGAHPANPYYQALSAMDDISDAYFAETGKSMVLYFLSNAATIRGENIKGIREELKRRLRAIGYKI